MEQTPLPPLVSDKVLAQALCLSDECLWLRSQYEEDRAKTREVVQALCNALEGTKTNPSWWREHPSESWIHDAMESAKELGIVPKK